MLTKKGIYTNIIESTYKYEYKSFVFYFSSRVYRDKFANGLTEYIKYEKDIFKNRFGVRVDTSECASLKLYEKIETRGYRVEVKETGETVTPDMLYYTMKLVVFNKK